MSLLVYFCCGTICYYFIEIYLPSLAWTKSFHEIVCNPTISRKILKNLLLILYNIFGRNDEMVNNFNDLIYTFVRTQGWLVDYFIFLFSNCNVLFLFFFSCLTIFTFYLNWKDNLIYSLIGTFSHYFLVHTKNFTIQN